MTASPLKVLLVDASLFTAPYDAALTHGLVAVGVQPMWATRPIRPLESQEVPAQYCLPLFYRRTDRLLGSASAARSALKGLSHLWGLLRLLARVATHRPDVIHFQWIAVPLADALAMRVLRLFAPVVLTVHDTVPFNGVKLSAMQLAGFELPMKTADLLIVHTLGGRQSLISRGLPADKIHIVPHGGLKLVAPMPPKAPRADGRYVLVLFGEIKPYKGVDLLVEAVAALPPEVRRTALFIIAGRPRMDLADIRLRIAQAGIEDCIELRDRRLADAEVAALFSQADCFLFPYRQIDASGVWFLTKSLGRWMIATKVGVFAEDMRAPEAGELIPPNDAPALAAAIERAVRARSVGVPVAQDDEWRTIGGYTRRLYESLQRARRDRTGEVNP